MRKKDRLTSKLIVCFLCLGLMGCQKEEVIVEATPIPTLEPTPTPVIINHTTLEESTSMIVDSFINGNTITVSNEYQGNLDEMKQLKGCKVTQDQHIYTNEKEARVVLECEKEKKYLKIQYDEELLPKQLELYSLPPTPTLEETEDYYEIGLSVGLTPQLNGILTIPYKTEYPSVAIIMPDGLYNDLDGSGDDPTFRKDLAHALAEEGIATVRYDMRLAVEPSLIQSNDDYSLNEIYYKDFASLVHMLERYPVDAGDILFVGHGLSANLAYASVYQHFEITGGIVLIDPLEENGLNLMGQVHGLSNEEIARVTQELEKEEKEETFSYPLSYFEEWNHSNGNLYLGSLRQRILILKSHTLTYSERNEYRNNGWITVKGYPIIGNTFRSNETLYPTLPSDIFKWILGLTIVR